MPDLREGSSGEKGIMTQDERIEKLEREVAELRGMVTVLMGRTTVFQPLDNGMPPPWTIEGPTFKRPSPPMCEVATRELFIHGRPEDNPYR